MNKPYFTKYIPVEGEIKEGDIFVFQDNDPPEIFKCSGLTDDTHLKVASDNEWGYGDWAKCYSRKVKLFLCSKDIQVGDRVRRDGMIGEGILQKPNYVQYEEVGVLDPSIEFFKVIGEVSPNALTFVKEGDEFTEDQISIYDVSHREDIEVNIKCPCCGDFK